MTHRRLPRPLSSRERRNYAAAFDAFASGATEAPVLEAPRPPRKQKPRAEREAGVMDAIKEWRKRPDVRPDVRLWRQNVGEFRLANGNMFRAGLCRGSSDFVGLHTVTITPAMVGKQVAVFFALEAKRPGELPEPHQQEWLDEVRDAGAIVGVVTCVSDAEDAIARWRARVEAE